MVTLVACPKPFKGDIGIIQNNAIKSWLGLFPPGQVILAGSEHGVREVCSEFGLKHIENIKLNAYGTPLLSSILSSAKKACDGEFLCLVNCDILLFDDFIETFEAVKQKFEGRDFFLSGRRWLSSSVTPLDFGEKEQNDLIKERLLAESKLDTPWAIDYFLFPKECMEDVPPFALGRCGWDNWLLYQAKRKGLRLVDATGGITAIHQRHDYSHSPFITKGRFTFIYGPEVFENLKLCVKGSRHFTLLDADFSIQNGKVSKICFSRFALRAFTHVKSRLRCLFKAERG